MAEIKQLPNGNTRETREHSRTARVSVQNGRSYCYVTCPFCDQVTRAYIWSLSGGGKKCQCGALHCGWGMSFKETAPRHFTFSQVGPSFVGSYKDLDLVTPDRCGTGEFVTVGNGCRIKVVFIKSEKLDDGTRFSELFGLGHDIDKHMSIIQYNRNLGGYLYSWATYK